MAVNPEHVRHIKQTIVRAVQSQLLTGRLADEFAARGTEAALSNADQMAISTGMQALSIMQELSSSCSVHDLTAAFRGLDEDILFELYGTPLISWNDLRDPDLDIQNFKTALMHMCFPEDPSDETAARYQEFLAHAVLGPDSVVQLTQYRRLGDAITAEPFDAEALPRFTSKTNIYRLTQHHILDLLHTEYPRRIDIGVDVLNNSMDKWDHRTGALNTDDELDLAARVIFGSNFLPFIKTDLDIMGCMFNSPPVFTTPFDKVSQSREYCEKLIQARDAGRSLSFQPSVIDDIQSRLEALNKLHERFEALDPIPEVFDRPRDVVEKLGDFMVREKLEPFLPNTSDMDDTTLEARNGPALPGT